MALVFYDNALKIREKVFGKEHIDTQRVFDNLKIVYDKSSNDMPFEQWLEENQ